MRTVRMWLMYLLCLSLVTATFFDWPVFCKVEVAVNAVALLVCIAVDAINRK